MSKIKRFMPLITENGMNISLTLPKLETLSKYSIISNIPIVGNKESWINPVIPKKRGIYFLFNKRELYYIGKSSNIRQRVTTHITPQSHTPARSCIHVPSNEINMVAFLLFQDDSFIDVAELFYITYYKPKYNFNPFKSKFVPPYELITPEQQAWALKDVPMR